MELCVDGAVDVVSLEARVRVAEGCCGGHGTVAAAHALAIVSAAMVFAATPVVSAAKRLLCLSLATSSRRPEEDNVIRLGTYSTSRPQDNVLT
jgi:hypothetical protein